MEALASQGDNHSARRIAQLLLLYDAGMETGMVAAQVGLSPSRTRYWRRRFVSEGMDIFPEAVLAAVAGRGNGGPQDVVSEAEGGLAAVEERVPVEPISEGPSDIPAGAPAGPVAQEALTWDDLRQRFPANLNRAEHCRDLALALFDGAQAVHRLEPKRRRLLETAALLHGLREVQEKRGHPAGYLSILTHPLAEVDEDDQKIIVKVLEYQVGKSGRKQLQNAAHMADDQRAALSLAALLRMAFGLDQSKSQTTGIVGIEDHPDVLRVFIDGPRAAQDGRSAQKQGRIWEELFEQKVFFHSADQAERAAELEKMEPLFSLKSSGVLADDPLSEAGRKVLAFHFAEMVRHEEGTRQGVDIEELHDMRVATRRMRAAFDVFWEAFEPKAIKGHLKGLRRTGRALGRVRDLDVFMEKAQHYLDALPVEQRHGLDPLLLHWQQEREDDREIMLKHLASKDYAQFKRKFLTFLTTPGMGARPVSDEHPVPDIVRNIVPALVYDRMAEVRGYGAILSNASIEQLHALRIEFKKLRYTLEFFREVLGPQAGEIIGEIKTLQDHLGDLNDADVACGILRNFLDELEVRQAILPMEERENPEPIVAYLAAKHAERHQLMVSFKDAWARFDRTEVRRQLAEAISVL